MNGFKKWLIGIGGSVAAAIIIALVFSQVDTRDRVRSMESAWQVTEGPRGPVSIREDAIELRGQVKALQDWRAEGARFTRANAEELERRLLVRIERLEDEIRALRK